jgi:hypothetical protein
VVGKKTLEMSRIRYKIVLCVGIFGTIYMFWLSMTKTTTLKKGIAGG